MNFMSNTTTKTNCPHCGYVIDAATCVGEPEARPSPGDISLCFKCGGINVFDTTLALRKPTEDEKAQLDEAAWDQIERVQKAMVLP